MPLLTWADLSRGEVSAALGAGAVAAIAVGAIEQHGEHLPCGTDIRLAAAVLHDAAGRASIPVLGLPEFAFGISGYHSSFGGTLPVRDTTFLAVLADLCAGVKAAGGNALVIVNGHGGNMGAIRTAALTNSTPDFTVAAVCYWELVPAKATELFVEDDGSIGHAGQAETSLMMAVRPETVHQNVDGFEQIKPPFGQSMFQRLGQSGVIGNPGAASRELGEEFFAAAADALATLFDSLAEAPVHERA